MQFQYTPIGSVTPSLVRAAMLNHCGDVHEGRMACPCGDSFDLNEYNSHIRLALRKQLDVIVLPSKSIADAVDHGASTLHEFFNTSSMSEWTTELYIGELAGWKIPATFIRCMKQAYPVSPEHPQREALHRDNTTSALCDNVFDHVGDALDFGPVENEVSWTCSCGEDFNTDTDFEKHSFWKLQESGVVFGLATELSAQANILTNIAKAISLQNREIPTLSEFHHLSDLFGAEVSMLRA